MPEITNKLLKQAIADAEAVRETAVANAKLVLEEAITPQIREMIARRLSAGALSEGEDEEGHDEEEHDEEEHDAPEAKAAPTRTAPPPARDAAPTRSAPPRSGVPKDESAKQQPHEDGTPVGGGKDFPAKTSIIGKGDNKDPSADAFGDSGVGSGPESAGTTPDDWYDDWNESDFDLSEIISELEEEVARLSEQDDADMADEDPTDDMGGEEVGDEELDLEEILRELEGDDEHSEEIPSDEAPVGKAPSAKPTDDELLAKVNELMGRIDALKEERAQYQHAVNELRSRLNEVNLLNSKLLYTNKMFRKEGLTNEQKVRIVESFDRATTVREVKLVYTAIVENLSVAAKSLSNRAKGRKVVAEGLASKTTRTTAPKREVIVENTVAHRLKELAGII
jgi:Arc/MetJ family transcription regulator